MVFYFTRSLVRLLILKYLFIIVFLWYLFNWLIYCAYWHTIIGFVGVIFIIFYFFRDFAHSWFLCDACDFVIIERFGWWRLLMISRFDRGSVRPVAYSGSGRRGDWPVHVHRSLRGQEARPGWRQRVGERFGWHVRRRHSRPVKRFHSGPVRKRRGQEGAIDRHLHRRKARALHQPYRETLVNQRRPVLGRKIGKISPWTQSFP